jgi:hypothetical protein
MRRFLVSRDSKKWETARPRLEEARNPYLFPEMGSTCLDTQLKHRFDQLSVPPWHGGKGEPKVVAPPPSDQRGRLHRR